jgi:8-oxo-dGTP pyrophosphatase MutT (NUDIX family)
MSAGSASTGRIYHCRTESLVSRVWKPSVTVAAVVEREGRFLLVEEHTEDGLRINQPAGHLDPGETLLQAVTREALEETAHPFRPTALLGIYLWRSPEPARTTTYLRFAFTGELDERIAGLQLDRGIVRTLWLSREQVAQRAAQWRSPLVARCIDDYLGGRRYPLDLLYTHPAALAASAAPATS